MLCFLHWVAFKPFERQHQAFRWEQCQFLKYLITLYLVCILKLALLCVSQNVYPMDIKKQSAGLRLDAGNVAYRQLGCRLHSLTLDLDLWLGCCTVQKQLFSFSAKLLSL